MRKDIFYLLILLLIVGSIAVFGDNYNMALTRSMADTLYCQINGDCNLTTLYVTNYTYINTTIISSNITGNINAYSISINGTSLYNIFLQSESDPYWQGDKINYYTKVESDAAYCAIGSCGTSSSNDLDIYGNMSLQKNIDWNSTETGDNDLYPIPEKIILIGGEFT